MGATKPKYARVLLKLSGEALLGKEEYGIDPEMLGEVAKEVHGLQEYGVEVALVIGGGQHFPRSRALASGNGAGHRGPDRYAGHGHQCARLAGCVGT